MIVMALVPGPAVSAKNGRRSPELVGVSGCMDPRKGRGREAHTVRVSSAVVAWDVMPSLSLSLSVPAPGTVVRGAASSTSPLIHPPLSCY